MSESSEAKWIQRELAGITVSRCSCRCPYNVSSLLSAAVGDEEAGMKPDAHGDVVVDVGAEVEDRHADDALGRGHDVPQALLQQT